MAKADAAVHITDANDASEWNLCLIQRLFYVDSELTRMGVMSHEAKVSERTKAFVIKSSRVAADGKLFSQLEALPRFPPLVSIS